MADRTPPEGKGKRRRRPRGTDKSGQFLLRLFAEEHQVTMACWICGQQCCFREALHAHVADSHSSYCTVCRLQHSGLCTPPKRRMSYHRFRISGEGVFWESDKDVERRETRVIWNPYLAIARFGLS